MSVLFKTPEVQLSPPSRTWGVGLAMPPTAGQLDQKFGEQRTDWRTKMKSLLSTLVCLSLGLVGTSSSLLAQSASPAHHATAHRCAAATGCR
jgi:hypothetical protein